MFPIAQRYVDRVVLVTDNAIRKAQEALWRGDKALTAQMIVLQKQVKGQWK